MSKMKSKLSWSWVLKKRLLQMDNSLFEEGNWICYLATKQIAVKEEFDDILESNKADIPCGIGTCNKVFRSLAEYESHYSSVHRNVCSVCKRCFPSHHLLDIHISEWHDSMFELMAQKQSMCLIPSCGVKLSNRKKRKDHMIKIHKYPSNFRFDREKKVTSKSIHTNKDGVKITQNPAESLSNESMEVSVETIGQKDTQTPADIVSNKSMEVSVEKEKENKPKIQYSYRVPQNFSFGHGVSRGFQRKRGRGRGSKSRHWHNQSAENGNMQVDIENINMNDLTDALNS